MDEIKWLEVTVNTTPDRLDEVCAKLAAAGMDSSSGTTWTRSCWTG